ncbi:MAG: hypothetical protein QMD85_01250 [Candidatus Aenigmarchaeota archaeon]|nr:hypothetical protein [Candidatus Aenigmarchaeota archaeon]MDI6722174.1 hypothetical protein [Candidatus Aenigmarchaeota archaeon]
MKELILFEFDPELRWWGYEPQPESILYVDPAEMHFLIEPVAYDTVRKFLERHDSLPLNEQEAYSRTN